MSDTSRDELRRVLRMVEAGKLTGEEADRLLSRLRNPGTQRCRYCAESIPQAVATCPECRSRLIYGSTAQSGIGALPKALMVYLFIVCGVVILFSFKGGVSFCNMTQMALAGVGLIAAFLILKHNPLGWMLGAAWSAAQIIVLVVNRGALNRQFLHIGAISTTNGSGLGINLVGIVLLVLFIVASNSFQIERGAGYGTA